MAHIDSFAIPHIGDIVNPNWNRSSITDMGWNSHSINGIRLNYRIPYKNRGKVLNIRIWGRLYSVHEKDKEINTFRIIKKKNILLLLKRLIHDLYIKY